MNNLQQSELLNVSLNIMSEKNVCRSDDVFYRWKILYVSDKHEVGYIMNDNVGQQIMWL